MTTINSTCSCVITLKLKPIILIFTNLVEYTLRKLLLLPIGFNTAKIADALDETINKVSVQFYVRCMCRNEVVFFIAIFIV